MLSKKFQKKVGVLVFTSQMFSVLAPVAAYAAPAGVSGTDTKNALETVGTKANRLKTVGASGVDESSGAFTYSYPFSLPKGKMGLEPAISLSYNSQSSENSVVGYGWNLALPSIERSAKKGVDKIYTNNDFLSTLGGELVLKSGTTNTYIQKIDDGSYQEYTLSNNTWTLRDRSGNTYLFGLDSDSKLFDIKNTSKNSKWYLSEMRDVFGNRVKYIYEKKDNFIYPKEIQYTLDKSGSYSNKIVFERETRLDTEKSYKTQFLVELREKIKTIRAYSDNVEVAKIELAYTTGQNGSRSLLSAIKESRVGTEGQWSTIPETKFEYTKGENISSNLTWQQSQQNSIRIDYTGDAKIDVLNTNFNGQNFLVLDINGDYYPDMYSRYKYLDWYRGLVDSTSNDYKKNIEGNFQSLPLSSLNLLTTYTWSNWLGYSGPYISVANSLDLNADGLTDIISNDNYNRETGTYLNIGGNFQKTNLFNSEFESLKADFNGDGLVDKVQTYASTTNSSISGEYVYLNNGTSWNEFPELNFKIPTAIKIKDYSGTIDIDSGVRFSDVNGDGLVDIYRSYNSTALSPYSYSAPLGNYKELYLNTGSSFKKIDNPNLSDYTVNYYNNYQTATNSYLEEGANLSKQDILKNITSPLGSKSDISYIGSASTGLNPKLPINMLVVDKIVENETVKGLQETTSYKWENGKMYYDEKNVFDRRFAGFGKVTTSKGNLKIVKYFHQGDGDDLMTYERGDSIHLIGRVYKEETWGGSNKYSENYNLYGVYSYNGQIYKYPKEEVSTSYDTQGGKISKAVTYEYDLSARLPKEIKNWGEVSLEIATNTFTDKGDDMTVTKNISTTKRPQKVLSEETFDIDGNFLDKKYYFYDNLPFGYVEKGLLTEQRDYSSASKYIKTSIAYNDFGLPISQTDNDGNITTTTYDTNLYPQTITNALGQTNLVKYDKVSGQVVEQTDSNGKFAKNVYDGFGNNIASFATVPSTGNVEKISSKSISYNGHGLETSDIVYKDGSIYKDTVSIYDSFGRQISSKDKVSALSYKTVDTAYNNLGQLVSQTYPYDSSGFLAGLFGGLTTTYTYDDLGRVIKSKLGDNESNIVYLVNGKIVTDNSGHIKKYYYNSLGKISSVVENLNGVELTTKYSWNILGKLIKIIDAENNVRNFSYDSEGRLLAQEDLHALSDATFGKYKYSYDVLGNLLSKTDPTGNLFAYKYDSLYRPIAESNGDLVTKYTYDNCTNGIGKLCSLTNSEYSQNITYNKSGLQDTETKKIDDKLFTSSYFYNSFGQNTKIVLPDSSIISYEYELNGKQKTATLTQNTNGTASTTKIVTDAKYNIDDTVKEIAFGNNLKNCYEYSTTNGGNTAPRLSGIFVNNDCSNTGDILKNQFSEKIVYNLDGKIKSTEDSYFAGTDVNKNSFTYDTLDRLTGYENLNGSLTTNNSFKYSSIGNILSANGKEYLYSGADYQNPHAASIIGSTKMSYDLNGNVLSDDKNIYTWTKKNTIAKVENDKSISEYTYDISGERIKEKVKTFKSSTSTTLAIDDYEDNTIFSTLSNSDISTTTNVYLSKESFVELKSILNLATVTKQDVMSVVMPIYASAYVTNTCKTVIASKKDICERDSTLKAIYVKYAKEKNVYISYGTLLEIWNLFKGKFQIPGDSSIYTNSANRKFTLILDTKNSATYNQANLYVFNNVYTKEIGGYSYLSPTQRPVVIWNKINLVDTNLFSIKNATLTIKSLYNLPTQIGITEITNQIDTTAANISPATSTTQTFATSSNFVDGPYGWWGYVLPITNYVSKQDKSNDFNGLMLENKSIYNYLSSYSNSYGWDLARPKIDLEYEFTGKLNSYIATTTKVVADTNLNDIYDAYTKGVVSQKIESGPDTYISEDTYTILSINKLNAKSKVELLFDLALDNDYVKNTCKTDVACFKIQAQQFVGTYLYQKYNISLTAKNLEEMWGVYSNKLLFPRSNDVYVKTLIDNPETIRNEAYGCWANFTSISTQSSCIQNYKLDKYKNKFVTASFTTYATSWWGPPFYYDITVNGIFAGNSISQNISTTTDISKLLTKALANNGSVSIDFAPDAKGTVSSGGMVAWTKNLTIQEYIYQNKLNQATSTTLTNADIQNKIVNKNDIGMYGTIYKESKIPALFANDKLISKETFAEIQKINLSFMNLVIYDKLIDTSFAPYSICDKAVDEDEKYNCRKTIFVKYLYAIVKYEKGVDLSADALDEIFEVLQGHNSVPSDMSDYFVRDTKIYNKVDSGHVTDRTLWYYSMQTDGYVYSTCEIGAYFDGTQHYRVCRMNLNLDPEIISRRSEIEKVETNVVISKGRDTLAGGNYAVLPYTVPAVLFTTSDGLISSTSTLVNLEQNTTLDISEVVKSIAAGKSSSQIMLSNTYNYGHSYLNNFGNLQLKVTFAKPANQNEAKYQTPLVTDPKDADVYTKVLEVLGRIDKDYSVGDNTIISEQTWNEIKNSNLKTVDDIKKVFNDNSRLQKDQTLSSVNMYFKNTFSISLSREALEELYMVSDNKLQMPIENDQYKYVSATTTKIYFDQKTWKPYYEDSNGTKFTNQCAIYNSSHQLCSLTLPAYSKYQTSKSAILNIQVNYFAFNYSANVSTYGQLSSEPKLADRKLTTNSSQFIESFFNSLSFDLTNVLNEQSGSNQELLGQLVLKANTNSGNINEVVQNPTSQKMWVEYKLEPNFKMFDRKTFSNLSVVDGVKNDRSLLEDINFAKKYNVSKETYEILEKIGVTKKSDIYQFSTNKVLNDATSTVSKSDKIDLLKNIFANIRTIKNASVDRETLEEIYYVLNEKLTIAKSATSTDALSRKDLGLLEVLVVDGVEVYSTNENFAETNATYTVAANDMKLISDDTMGELSLAGISSRDQIVDIMKLTQTTYKDSKISFFNQYVKTKKGYEFSRVALEEIYMVYAEQAFLQPVTPINGVVKVTKSIELKNRYNKVDKNTGCTFVGVTYDTWWVEQDCVGKLTIDSKPGYKISAANVLVNGDVQTAYYGYQIVGEIAGKSTTFGKTNDLSKFVDINSKLPIDIRIAENGTPIGWPVQFGSMTLEVTYDPISSKFTKENFGSLEDVNPLSKINEEYKNEIEAINFANSSVSTTTVSTSSMSIISPETWAEIAATSINNNQNLKSVLDGYGTSTDKTSKLNQLSEKIKSEKNITLSQLGLEELWDAYQGKVIIKSPGNQGQSQVLNEKLTIGDKYNGVASTYYAGYSYAGGSGYCGVFGYYESDCLMNFGGFKTKPGFELQSANLVFNYYSNTYGQFDINIGLPKQNYQLYSYQNTTLDIDDNIKFTVNNSYGPQPVQTIDITKLVNKSTNNPNKTNFDPFREPP
jgi:YD repeat-containing protein